jgi:hypothetical protein
VGYCCCARTRLAVRVSDPGNGVASGFGRAGSGVGLKVLVGARGLRLGSGQFRGWSWRKEVELGLALGWLWDQSFQSSHGRAPEPQPIGEGTFVFCSSALMSLVSGFAATT